MANTDGLPQVGDVVRSVRFVYGYRDYANQDKKITVGQDDPKHVVSRHMTDDEIVSYIRSSGFMPENKRVDQDFGAPDLSRANAEFVVIEAQMQGGGVAMFNDVYPDGWHVVAKRLDENGKWNSEGEEIQFYMTGSFMDLIPPNKVLITRRLNIIFP